MVPGYELGACIHAGRYRFYEATSPAHGAVFVRLHASPVPSERDLAATRHAAAVGARLSAVDGVVPHVDLVPSGRDLALVTARVEGARPLRSSVGGAASLAELCRLGASVATVLGALHRQGLVYCALSPDSVFVDPTGAAHLADLGRATDVEAETPPLFDPARLGAALTYVSPEQTGRVNRAVDARSDLYCLGLVLFELVAGSPPFTDPSPRSLAHAHIARRPPRLDERRPGCPVLLADLVDRLLGKQPEDRYATAIAVADDLRAIADDIAAGRTPSFPLGLHDVEPRLRLSDVLFGRDGELAALHGALDGAAAGGRELAFVSGYSGIGKSRLVNELHRPVAALDGWFGTGKFDLYRRDLPYAAFIQAAGELVRQVLTLPEAELDALSARLTDELRASAAALGELIPDLALLIGEQEPPGDVSPAEAQRRLEAGIRTLVRVVASVEHPLVLFVDDLQWSDLASLRLLDALIDDGAASALLVIVAWRDNEVGPAHQAWDFVQRHRERAVNLVLDPLGVGDVTEWLAASVHEETGAVADLARLTHDKTLGNPFFVRQFLRDLVVDDVLRIGGSGMWSWDTATVERRGVSENVGDLVSRQVGRLPSGVRQALQAASCVGPEFDLDSVVGIIGGARDDAVVSLHAALRAGLILPRDDAYPYASDHSAGINPRFAFLHDRVQEVGHESMRPDVRTAAHLALARRGMAEGDDDPARVDELAVDVASHLSAGISALDDPAERIAAARWLVAGAVRAKAVMATEPAQVFLDHADALLPVERWATHPDLARRLHTEAADIAYIEGRFADIDRHAAPVLAHTTAPLDRMPIHNIHIGIGVAQNRWAEATRYAIDVLADEYGVALPYTPSLPAVAAELAKMRWQLRHWSIDDLRGLPPMTDELVDASMSLLMKTATNAYWASPNLVPLIGLTMVRQSIRHGNSGLSAYGYVLYGLVLSAVLFEAERGYRFGELAMEILDRFTARHLVGKTGLVHHGFIRPGVDPMATCGSSVLEGFHEAHAAGDIENAAYCAMAALYTAIVSGEPLPALTERLAPYVDAVRASGHEQTIYGTSVWLQAVDNLTADVIEPELRGEHIDFERRLGELLESETGNAVPQGVCAAGFLAFLLGDDERA
ncbi:MAG TPA: AAA family ATPase, partial [Acidimicrobiales bacterium]|nr:AAA family ATPase [Acidimicrobiales bacterium]